MHHNDDGFSAALPPRHRSMPRQPLRTLVALPALFALPLAGVPLVMAQTAPEAAGGSSPSLPAPPAERSIPAPHRDAAPAGVSPKPHNLPGSSSKPPAPPPPPPASPARYKSIPPLATDSHKPPTLPPPAPRKCAAPPPAPETCSDKQVSSLQHSQTIPTARGQRKAQREAQRECILNYLMHPITSAAAEGINPVIQPKNVS